MIRITAEYLPGALNKEAGFKSRSVKDSSKWKLDYKIFQTICSSLEIPDIDLLASRSPHQVPAYMSWKLDPFSKGRDAFQITWIHLKDIPLFLPKTENLLLGPNREMHPLIEQENLQLPAWTVSGKDYMQKEFRNTWPLLSQMPEDQVQMLITNWSGVSSITGVLKDGLIALSVLSIRFCNS